MDLIDRWQAIDRINDENIEAHMDSVMDGELQRTKRAVQRIVASMPSARPKGKWIRITHGADPEIYMCSVCKRKVNDYGPDCMMSIRYPYCHCGAEMREED